jgi:hypothetical protein
MQNGLQRPPVLRFIQKLIANHDGGDHAGQLGHQRAGHGMARALNAHGTKVHGQHVERGFGAALNRGCSQSRKTVHALALHGLDQHGARRAAGKRLDQRRGQGIDKAGIHAQDVHRPADGRQRIFQCPRGAKHAHGAKHGDQIGQKVLATSKPSLAPSIKLSYTATLRNAPRPTNSTISANSVRLPMSEEAGPAPPR